MKGCYLEKWFKASSVLIALFSPDMSAAQVVGDTTLPIGERSQVTGNPNFQIDGGATRGGNLFHSFSDFSIPTGGSAFFNNAADVQNILTRVTGGSISNIDGLIRANGTANLFLLNPNGIIFGQNASLNIGGSFVATTANALGFGNVGFFSASNPEVPSSLLTINPSALLFNQLAASPIQNNSTAPAGTTLAGDDTFGLRVPNGRSLLLVGGNISLDGGGLNALGGQLELGGLSSAGTVGLNGDGNDLSLSFPDSVARSDIFLSNGAQVNVIASDGGSIALNARNLEMTGDSGLVAGIERGLGSNNSQAGNIAVNATGAINLNYSAIVNQAQRQANGQGGDVNISASTLQLEGGARIYTVTSGAGKGGSLSVDAQDVQIIGTSADGRFFSALAASTNENSTGNAGDLTIKTNTLLVRDGAQVSTTTFGAGNAGSLSVDAQDVQLIGRSADGRATSGLYASAERNSTGNAGDLTIKTNTLLVRDGAMGTYTFGAGNAGSLRIDAQEVQIDGQFYSSSVLTSAASGSTGDAGNLTIKTNTLLVRGRVTMGTYTFGAGKAGDLTIRTNTLLVRDGAQVLTATFGAGNAGFLSVDAQDVQIIGTSANGQTASALVASAAPNSTGNAGDLTIKTNTLLVRDGAQVGAGTVGAGKGGDLSVDAQDVQIIGTSADGRIPSLLYTSALSNLTGDAGDLTIKTNTLLVRDGARVITDTRGAGKAGDLEVNAQDVQIIGTSADGRFPSGLFASTDPNSTGDARDLRIETNTLLVQDGALVTVQSRGTGTAGNLFVEANQIYLNNQGRINADTSGGGGNINLRSPLILLRNGSNISTNARGSNIPGGNIDINTDNLVAVPSEDSNITANSQDFRGGNVIVRASGIFGIEFREQLTPLSDITATGVSEEFRGTVEFITPGIDPARGLAELPTEVVDATDAIAQGCPANEGNSFVVTGRGGLPPNPEQQLDDDAEWLDRRRLTVDQQTNPGTEGSQQHSEDRLDTRHSAHHPPLIEATGWEMAPTGQVILTASATNVTPSNRWGQPVNCDRS
ncbi:MAG: filamentous hemagglutinin N-terminal domain-containing protein [Symplocastrum torsivum CPER-KK1]|jgi:filamentous hemagglutinin family protein|uniref:Filamentous hemagglutinin N-terminal domain-containing protein n=1 Tax=Symplocastrum torsivum CPER-KK1 TaxID=450513 RepID=A0A951PRS3_9CYAN|nr:filamentous hemagglutinin N-terminal domain-containing protein [Symplocastrum torsivum CPER-KK1]